MTSPVSWLLRLLSAEFLLRKRPNGGGVVLARAIWSSFWIYLAAVAAHSLTKPGATLNFDAGELRESIHETLPWLGAILAGTYTVFYSRFASQWAYLAELYNRMMEAAITLEGETTSDALPAASTQRGRGPCGGTRGRRNVSFQIWKAAFVEDAFRLHLADKDMFRAAVAGYLSEHVVQIHLADEKCLGKDQLRDLGRKLGVQISVADDTSNLNR